MTGTNMAADTGSVSWVANTLELTRREGSAAVRYCVQFVPIFVFALYHGKRPDDEKGRQRERQLWVDRGWGGLDGDWGRIQLDGDRSLYRDHAEWQLWIDGVNYSGIPGEWEFEEAACPLNEFEPQWLLALIAGCVESRVACDVVVRGEPMVCVATTCDLRLAAAKQARRMVPPSPSDGDAKSATNVDIWVDARRRIRRAVRYDGRARTVLELCDFGRPLPIDMPAESEMCSD